LAANKIGAQTEQTLTGLTAGLARTFACDAGFTEAGLVSLPYAQQQRDAERFESWIEAGRSGSMAYLKRKDEAGESFVRARVSTPFPWARSAIVCFASYNSSPPRSIAPADSGAGWIARYAWSSRVDPDGARRPSDYHKVLLKRLRALESKLRGSCGAFESRAYVDTGPVVERSLATAAGLGWTGKNTCLIHPRLGSFGFLGVLLTSLEVTPKSQGLEAADRCGSCTRCIQACPTNALIAPYQMDATKCISYLTIEHKGPIQPELMAAMGRQVFGCDICQDVCPWNRKAPIAADPDLAPRPELVNPALEVLAALDNAAFERMFNGSPVRRAGFVGLLRNIAIAAANAGATSLAPRLHEWANAQDEHLRTAARWALGKLNL
jgi:epoxyqueuosine reductase